MPNLSKGASKILGNLLGEANKIAREVVLQRGGGGSQVRHLQHLADKTLGEIAEWAAQGDSAARTAIKIIKQAASKAQKYQGK